ncbi:MAG: phosphate regulon sensor histidine kinase PhoR [Gammaproteobacteria bacterium]|nr:phosphate regulon sensor histidine kinase PhoR [Gammaproteobacteria bacterium]
MNPALRAEVVRVALLAFFGVLVGGLSVSLTLGALAFCAAYLALNLWRLAQLRAWLRRPKQAALPDGSGLWGEVFERLTDIQRRNRKRKKRLAHILAEFQASTAALPDGAVVLASRGEIVWFNDAAQALLGLRVSQDFGQRVVNLVRHPNFIEYFASDDYRGEVEAPSPVNPAVICSLRIIPYGNGQRLLIVRDVSEARRLEATRRDFVANASHELRTPLTVLRGYLDLIEPETHGAGPLQPWRSPLREMRKQVTRMEALIGDLLKLARLEAEAIHSRQDLVDVPQMLTRLRDEAAAMSAGQHRFEAEIDTGLLLFGHESELHSVFSNLLTNAVQYTPPGGIVRLRWWSDDRGACFAVADTGIGIAAEDVPRITERFYRVDVSRSRERGGTGLGLAIVKHALELHEGRLQVESELGVGSTFTCLFPPQRVRRRDARVPAVAAVRPAD